ncbi:unnamed protein product [Enterobius vermicularis]|uniref:LRRCT domain-containing protein n=1 Tax=Enterobius vermicularis TaxID=51028 RepID=A0A0N4VMR7_ENTVE|nr:unnamed protein product [Enterobius vermicularis]
MPNLMILDLSNNEIVLHEEMIDFLSHTPRLHQLYLRRAFTAMNKDEKQLHLLMKINLFFYALQILDLSYNFFTTVPYNLPCPFPSLTELDLKQNYLQSFDIDTSCISKLRTLDISRYIAFKSNFSCLLKIENSIVLNNHFICDCNSSEYIYWIRNSTSIADKNSLLCYRAIPAQYKKAKLMEVPVEELNCTVADTATTNLAQFSFTTFLTATIGAFVLNHYHFQLVS